MSSSWSSSAAHSSRREHAAAMTCRAGPSRSNSMPAASVLRACSAVSISPSRSVRTFSAEAGSRRSAAAASGGPGKAGSSPAAPSPVTHSYPGKAATMPHT